MDPNNPTLRLLLEASFITIESRLRLLLEASLIALDVKTLTSLRDLDNNKLCKSNLRSLRNSLYNLQALGAKRQTSTEQSRYLTKIAMEF